MNKKESNNVVLECLNVLQNEWKDFGELIHWGVLRLYVDWDLDTDKEGTKEFDTIAEAIEFIKADIEEREFQVFLVGNNDEGLNIEDIVH